jgi:hypothetical protein
MVLLYFEKDESVQEVFYQVIPLISQTRFDDKSKHQGMAVKGEDLVHTVFQCQYKTGTVGEGKILVIILLENIHSCLPNSFV